MLYYFLVLINNGRKLSNIFKDNLGIERPLTKAEIKKKEKEEEERQVKVEAGKTIM
jgi:hypothetical protein